MLRQPLRQPAEPILKPADFRRMVFASAVLSVGALGSYGYGLLCYGIGAQANTLAFIGLTMGQLLHAFSCRSDTHSLFDAKPLPANPALTFAVGGSLVLQLLEQLIPGFRSLLGLASLTCLDSVVVGQSAVLPLVVNELTEAYARPAMKTDVVFTSESVTEGHPDKLCDQISDAIVDRFLQQDPCARIIAECAASTAILFVAARFDANASVDFPAVARLVINRVGYDQPAFNSKTCSVVTSLKELPHDQIQC